MEGARTRHSKIVLSAVILALIVFAVTSTAAQVYPEGMACYWKLDEGHGATASDSAGENHGSINGAVWSTGQIGEALSFGNNSYVVVPISPDLSPEQITIETWVNPTGSGWPRPARATSSLMRLREPIFPS